MNKEGGWNKCKELTEKQSKALDQAVESEGTIEEKMVRFEKIHDKIKYKSFGKVTIGPNKRNEQNTAGNKSTEEIKEDILKEQEEKVSKEIEDIKSMKKSKVGKIWEIRRRVLGGKKATQEATAIVDPNSGKIVASRAEIKQVSLDYCKDTLKDNDPTKGYEVEIQTKKDVVKAKLQENNGSFGIRKETFDSVLAKFKKSNKRNYDFLVKAGKGFQMVVFKFCKEMCAKESFPTHFKNTTLHMIFKGGAGRRQNLPDNRFVHSKTWLPRTAEALVVEEGLRGPLVEGSSRYQIGGQPGHRSEELVFVLKSVIARQRSQGKIVIIQPSDIKKFFDTEMVEDVFLTSLNRGADPKACRLWYKLNEDTQIRVRTGAGMSKYV